MTTQTISIAFLLFLSSAQAATRIFTDKEEWLLAVEQESAISSDSLRTETFNTFPSNVRPDSGDTKIVAANGESASFVTSNGLMAVTSLSPEVNTGNTGLLQTMDKDSPPRVHQQTVDGTNWIYVTLSHAFYDNIYFPQYSIQSERSLHFTFETAVSAFGMDYWIPPPCETEFPTFCATGYGNLITFTPASSDEGLHISMARGTPGFIGFIFDKDTSSVKLENPDNPANLFLNIDNVVTASATPPTPAPSQRPTRAPSESPSTAPTLSPTTTNAPSEPPSTTPTSSPTAVPLTAFVTSEQYNPVEIQGLPGADQLCQAHADTANLQGIFRAWMGDSTVTSIHDRFVANPGTPYALVNGTIVGQNLADMLNSSLSIGVVLSEDGTFRATGGAIRAWTGILPDGRAEPRDHCNNWTTNSDAHGRFGTVLATDKKWTSNGRRPCIEFHHIYCFQQVEE